MIFIDSNILIDVIEADANWFEWSSTKLIDAKTAGRVVINHVVVAEVAPYTTSLQIFVNSVESMDIEIEPLCNDTAYAAGLAFSKYRKRRDKLAAKTILPDFLIGGHAATIGATILTRDPRFYRTYFPSVPLITPSKDDHD